MRMLYFDIAGGISGDMTVAALLNLGASHARLKDELKKLKITGYTLKRSVVSRGHIKAEKFDVVVTKPKNYSYGQIVRRVKKSTLSRAVKKNILLTFKELKAAETKVHAHRHRDIHFDELGNIDSIVDIAAVCICLDLLDVESIYYSLIPLNKNIAPATFELLKGNRIYFRESVFENVTPTGMAILAALGKQYDTGLKATFGVGRCGYGAGSINSPDATNVLRIMEVQNRALTYEEDEVFQIQANIDDMNPEVFEYVFDRLFGSGALDVFLSTVYMKKTRPGFLLTVLSKAENFDKIAGVVLSETSTTGLRFDAVRRLKLPREIKELKFKGIKVRVKLIKRAESTTYAPEYEDCKKAAVRLKLPFLETYEQIKREAKKSWHFQG